MAESTQSETDEQTAYGKMQTKMASVLFVRRLAFRETNGDGAGDIAEVPLDYR
jgi:hypothetical protein